MNNQRVTNQRDQQLYTRVLNASVNPQELCWRAMHQCYSTEPTGDAFKPDWGEAEFGKALVNKLLKGDRGHFGCYFEDTEVFTSEGWLKWQDVKLTTQLAAVDTEGYFTFEFPAALQKYAIQDETLIKLTSGRVSYLVTPDHRMYIGNREGSMSIKTALESTQQRVKRFKKAATYKGGYSFATFPFGISSRKFSALVGFFLGDGSDAKKNNIRFNLREERKLEYAETLGIKTRKDSASSLTISGIGDWFATNCYQDGHKSVPSIFWKCSRDELEALFEGLKNSDGTNVKPSGGFCYDTTSPVLLQQLEELGVRAGYVVSVCLNNPSKDPQHKDGWRLTFSKETEAVLDSRYTYTEEFVERSGFVYCASVSTGLLLIRHEGKQLVCGNCLEHGSITFNVCGFPHSVINQARTHRIGCTFDVQSFRYTCPTFTEDIEDIIYLRPVGSYTNRQGKSYEYTSELREQDLRIAEALYAHYVSRIDLGLSEEHARGLMPFELRQHFVVTFNPRSLMHFLDLRHKADAQLEIKWLAEDLFAWFQVWMPQVAGWYGEKRLGKGKLAP